MKSTPLHGAVAGLLAVSCTTLVLGSVAGLFGQASQLPWLAPTPDNLAAVQRCHAQRSATEQRACRERAVAAALQPVTPATASADAADASTEAGARRVGVPAPRSGFRRDGG